MKYTANDVLSGWENVTILIEKRISLNLVFIQNG